MNANAERCVLNQRCLGKVVKKEVLAWIVSPHHAPEEVHPSTTPTMASRDLRCVIRST